MTEINRGDVLDLYRDIGVLRQRVQEGDLDGETAICEAEQMMEELLAGDSSGGETAALQEVLEVLVNGDGDATLNEIRDRVNGEVDDAMRRAKEWGWVGERRDDRGQVVIELSPLAEWLRDS